jgi:peptide/nickel transport system permease protein
MADPFVTAPATHVAPGAPPLETIETDSRVEVASQWQLMWWRFRKHKLALASAVVTLLVYLVAVFAEPLAPFGTERYIADYPYAPPQRIRFLEKTPQGTRWNPHVYGYTRSRHPVSLRVELKVDPKVVIPVRFFAVGEPYKLWNTIELKRHLVTPANVDAPMYLMGSDKLGRDILSRTIYGARVSMSIGLVGVLLSLVLGVLLGGISGYYGGRVDEIIQRVIEFLRSIPYIPLWMGLAAAIPLTWPPLRVYFAITVILSIIGWTALGREVRGRFAALRHEDFVTAARLDGCPEMRVILHHMVPSATSHIIARVTLAIPQMIISETSLSFLGIGLRPPVVSWGVLLQDAQNIRSVATAPWLLFAPAMAVIIIVLAMNFLGDGLRDAADPYGT